jgi:phage repressor protein C with HTH and peptisase S24 domain
MSPVLESYDRVLVDTSDRTPSPPGIFVLYDGLGLVVKRVEHVPHSEPARFVVASANPDYGRYELGADELYIVGRAVWFARRL